jgi:hypothetical protein
MTMIQIGRAYPLKSRVLNTHKDDKGKVYTFQASHFVVLPKDTIRVMGQDEYEAWCRLDFKAKNAPKWLRRGIRDAEKMQAK